jgi:UDP-N-acetylmuramoyl-tripeptide--D-alanyl-D-alanine ligase
VFDFALRDDAVVTAEYRSVAGGAAMSIATPAGPLDLRLPLAGEHSVRNALAATAASLAIGVPLAAIRRGLESFAPVAGRGVRLTLASGALLIDETYNANPDSVRAAIDVLAAAPPPRTLVLGDMGEVGARGPEFHREVGAYARVQGVERLLGFGELARESVAAFGAGARHCESIDDLNREVEPAARAGGTLLVKGSRFMRMERVIAALVRAETAGAH